MIRALIRNPNTGQQRWFIFPLYFGKLSEIGFLVIIMMVLKSLKLMALINFIQDIVH